MKLHEFKLMGIEQLYVLPPNARLPNHFQIKTVPWHLKMRGRIVPTRLYDFDNMRTIISRGNVDTHIAYHYYLYWLESRNLSKLDELVVESQVDDSHLEDCVVTRYQLVKCIDKCKRIYHSLVAESLDFYLSKPPEQNMDRLKKLSRIKCPNCGTVFRIPVVKVFEDVISP